MTRTPLSRSEGQRITCRGGAYCGDLSHSLLGYIRCSVVKAMDLQCTRPVHGLGGPWAGPKNLLDKMGRAGPKKFRLSTRRWATQRSAAQAAAVTDALPWRPRDIWFQQSSNESLVCYHCPDCSLDDCCQCQCCGCTGRQQLRPWREAGKHVVTHCIEPNTVSTSAQQDTR